MDAPRIDRLIPSIPIEPIPGKETRPINAGLSTLQDGCAQRVDTSSRNQFATPFFHQPKSTRLCVATSCAEQRWVVPQGQRIVWTRFVKQAGIFVWSQGDHLPPNRVRMELRQSITPQSKSRAGSTWQHGHSTEGKFFCANHKQNIFSTYNRFREPFFPAVSCEQ